MCACETWLGRCLSGGMLCLLPLVWTPGAAADWPLFQDALGPGWASWSWDAGIDFNHPTVTFEGQRAIAVDLAPWGALSLRHADFGSGPWESISFRIHGGEVGGQALKVFFHRDGGQGHEVVLNHPKYIEGGAVAAGAWRRVVIPLSDLGADNRGLTRFNLQTATADRPARFYVDDIRLVTAVTPRPFLISVDAAHYLGSVPTELFGSNAAWWNPGLSQDTDALAKLRAAGLTIVRFPGGSDADRYHWKEYEPGNAGNAWSTNTTEFLELLSQTSAAGLITVNFGTGTAQEAADWVRFTTLAHRGQVRYWEVGNEVYGAWERSWTHDPVAYVRGGSGHDGFNAFCSAMKAVDPSILVGAVGTAPFQAEHAAWLPAVLEHTDDCLDFISVHYYRWGQNDTDPYALLSDPPVSWPVQAEGLRRMLASDGRGRQLGIFVTEHNSYFGSTGSPPAPLAAQTVNMLYLADTLGQLLSQDIPLAAHWNIRTEGRGAVEYWGMLLGSLGNRRQPSYYAFPLWRYAGDQHVGATTNLDPRTEMTVYGTRNSRTGDLVLIVINKAQARTGTISLKNFEPTGRIAARHASGSALDAPMVRFNGLADADVPTDLNTLAPIVSAISGATFQYVFPAYSVTALTIDAVDPVCRECLPGRGGWRTLLRGQ